MSVFKKKRQDGTSSWYYDFAHDGRRYRGVGGTTKTQALRAQEKTRTQVISVEYELQQQFSNPRIEEFARTFLHRREHLRSRLRDDLSVRALLNVFAGRRLNEIGAGNIEDYIAKRRRDGVANGTINRELTCFKRMYNLAIKWKEAKDNPVLDVEFLEEPPGRTRYLYEFEAQQLIENASSHMKPIIITALNTGMRLGEISGLKW